MNTEPNPNLNPHDLQPSNHLVSSGHPQPFKSHPHSSTYLPSLSQLDPPTRHAKVSLTASTSHSQASTDAASPITCTCPVLKSRGRTSLDFSRLSYAAEVFLKDTFVGRVQARVVGSPGGLVRYSWGEYTGKGHWGGWGVERMGRAECLCLSVSFCFLFASFRFICTSFFFQISLIFLTRSTMLLLGTSSQVRISKFNKLIFIVTYYLLDFFFFFAHLLDDFCGPMIDSILQIFIFPWINQYLNQPDNSIVTCLQNYHADSITLLIYIFFVYLHYYLNFTVFWTTNFVYCFCIWHIIGLEIIAVYSFNSVWDSIIIITFLISYFRSLYTLSNQRCSSSPGTQWIYSLLPFTTTPLNLKCILIMLTIKTHILIPEEFEC